MKYKKVGSKYTIKITRGERILESLLKFCEENKIKSASFSGIGAAGNSEIAFYNVEEKRYEPSSIDRDMEIASLTGNVASFHGKPAVHAHIVLTDREMRAFGGHLKEATVSGACEIVLEAFDEKIGRKHDEETGLNLLDI